MQTPEALHAFFSRVTPVVPELFNMAYAICGNYDLAEYVVQYTLMEAWIGESRGGMGFREGMRHTLRQVAVEEALEPRENPPEFTWDGLKGESDDPVLKLLARESAETRRVVALRVGCGLQPARIARLMGVSAGRVREILDRFERSASRKLPAQQRTKRFDMMLYRSVGHAFDLADAGMPSLGVIYRTFEAEAQETRRPTHLAARIFRRALLIVLAAVLALVFWLGAVLIQPEIPEKPAGIVTEEGQ